MPKGKFLVIDGTDGSGKATQAAWLIERMRRMTVPVEPFSFPRYHTPTGQLIKSYLKGMLGSAMTIGPYVASGLYAADRLAAAPEIVHALMAGQHVIADRYVAANMGHQGSKIADAKARADYFRWNDWYEYVINGIPRPDMNVILHLPAEVSMARIATRGNARDEHETLEHLRAAEQTYLSIASSFPGFSVIECVQDGRELSKEEIHERVWETVSPLFAAAKQG